MQRSFVLLLGLVDAVYRRTADDLDRLLNVKRLWQVLKGAVLVGINRRRKVGVGRDNNKWDIRIDLMNLLDERQTIDTAWHIDVRHDDVRNLSL